MPIRVTVWHEYRHEKKKEAVRAVYPDGIHNVIAKSLSQDPELEVRTATLDEDLHGLPDDVLDNTDVMTWWGHGAHGEVDDKIAEKVQKRVLAGMGLIVLHSAHLAKPFLRLMGTTGHLKWRDNPPNKEVLWVTKPGHPILAGIQDHFTLAEEEMYGEYFDVPEPDELLLISSFTGGEVFRSGMTWTRGQGRIFYFRPGHETYRTYYDPNVMRVIGNAVRWAALPAKDTVVTGCPNPKMGWV